MKYEYKLLKLDGTVEALPTLDKQISFDQIRKLINCQIVEIIPLDYFNGNPEGVTLYGDEEGRFTEDYQRNPHTKVLTDPEGGIWDCVGEILMERAVQ